MCTCLATAPDAEGEWAKYGGRTIWEYLGYGRLLATAFATCCYTAFTLLEPRNLMSKSTKCRIKNSRAIVVNGFCGPAG